MTKLANRSLIIAAFLLSLGAHGLVLGVALRSWSKVPAQGTRFGSEGPVVLTFGYAGGSSDAKAPPRRSGAVGSKRTLHSTSQFARLDGHAAPAPNAPAAPSSRAGNGGTSPAAPSPSGGVMNYWSRLRQRILARIRYPEELQAEGVEGEALIELTIEPSGKIRSLTLKKSSGSPELDRIAIESARAAAPFEPFPTSEVSRSARIPIDFNLQ